MEGAKAAYERGLEIARKGKLEVIEKAIISNLERMKIKKQE